MLATVSKQNKRAMTMTKSSGRADNDGSDNDNGAE